MKQLSSDLKGGPDGLSDQEFQKKYKMSKQAARQELASNRKQSKPEPVSEAELAEDDIILVPGQGRKMKTGFVPHGKSRVDHEVEMARSDLLSAAKNAESIYQMIESTSEDEGLQGWVQEKIIKANDYLNSVREYLEGKQAQGVAEGKDDKIAQLKKDHDTAVHWSKNETSPQKREAARQKAEKIKAHLEKQYKQGVAEDKGMTQYNAFKREWRAKHGADAKVPGYDSKEYTSYVYRQNDKKQGVGEGAKVDRMVKHIEKSEKKLGKSKDEAENIAWATANKRGMLDNKNKKA
jgi:hypothetical protein